MSAIAVVLKTGETFYTKDYETIEEVDAAVKRGESLYIFWSASWGKRYQEVLLVDREDVSHFRTESEIP